MRQQWRGNMAYLAHQLSVMALPSISVASVYQASLAWQWRIKA